MALTDYAGLVAAILEEGFNDTELTLARRQRFVAQTETKMNRRLRVRGMIERYAAIIGSNTLTDDDTAFFALPDRFLGMESVELVVPDQDEPAILRVASALDLAGKAVVDDTRAQPQFYTLKAGEGRVWPVPDMEYTVQIEAYRGETPLSDSNQTNLWTDRYSDVLFDGCMARAAAFQKNFEEAGNFATVFEQGLNEIEAEDKRERALAAQSNRRARLTTEFPRLQRNLSTFNINTGV